MVNHVLTPEGALVLALIGFGVGWFGTLVGAGGGFILTPVLLLLYPDDSVQTITAIGLVAVFANSGSGTLAYLRHRRVDVRTGTVMLLSTFPGAVGGALLTPYVPRTAFDLTTATLLALVAVWVLVGRRPGAPQTGGRREHRHLVDRSGHTFDYMVPMRRGALMSAGIGFMSSLLGVGGGFIQVPVMVGALGFPTHIATATSHFILTGTSGVASITHVLSGSFAGGHGVYRALLLAVMLASGAQVGARTSGRLSGVVIERLLVAALLVIAVRLAFAA
ncbi:MAG: sulfite exporter TauE/SafE family protein [Actinobacteria bacterium]|nr:sulfite exporter TauE/SafE family protein [Thermoleophilia bacterium]MCB9011524.1 sulfite exporter TauE/SafE family protein [Actinomycetota bacterium]